jgi:hypothetical protein
MQQGFLFEPQAMAGTELQDAIARLDFSSAVRRLEEFHRRKPNSRGKRNWCVRDARWRLNRWIWTAATKPGKNWKRG